MLPADLSGMRSAIWILGLGILTLGCTVSVSGLDPNRLNQNSSGASASFEDDILPIFSKTLAGTTCISCHTGDTPLGNLNLDVGTQTAQQIYDALILTRIDKDNPAESELLKRPLGQSHLQIFSPNDADYTTILAWIEAGATFEAQQPDPNDGGMITPTPTPPPVADLSYFALQIYPRLGTCAGCHNGGDRMDLNDNTPSVVCNSIKNFSNTAVLPNNPTGSLFYQKPITAGVAHDGAKPWSAGVEGALLVQWISTNGKNASCTTP